MISKGLGIGILPEDALRPFAQALDLTLVELDEPWAARDFALCVRSLEELDPPSRRLLTFLIGDKPEPLRPASNFANSERA